MKVCFPIESNEGLNSNVNDHFGSTKEFLIYDTEQKKFDVVENPNANHSHGMCQPLLALNGKEVDVVVVGGVGAGALLKLNTIGIKVYKTKHKNVENNLKDYLNNNLSEIMPGDTCAGHGSCNHG